MVRHVPTTEQWLLFGISQIRLRRGVARIWSCLPQSSHINKLSHYNMRIIRILDTIIVALILQIIIIITNVIGIVLSLIDNYILISFSW